MTGHVIVYSGAGIPVAELLTILGFINPKHILTDRLGVYIHILVVNITQ